MARLSLPALAKMASDGEKIAALTCYDASFARVLEAAGVDVLLVGDSLGMVIQGRDSTLPVSMADMIYHTASVARGTERAFLIADLPFGSYQTGPEAALRNAVRLLAAGAQMVKLEGGAVMAETVRFLVERGIPVCGHIGLTPQSVHRLGGFRVQGRDEAAAQRLVADAHALQAAGAGLLVLELMPARLAARITRELGVPTIGIGAGPACAGQVLVLYDVLGISAWGGQGARLPRFAADFLAGRGSVAEAVRAYVAAVKDGRFPGPEHSFE